MDNIYLIAFSVAIVFMLAKFFEVRFILKERIVLKQLVIDTILTYFSVIIGYFVIDQFADKTKSFTQAPVFIDNPKF